MLNVILWKKGIHKDLDGTTDDESVVSQRTAENLEMDSVHAMDKVRASIVLSCRIKKINPTFHIPLINIFLQLYN